MIGYNVLEYNLLTYCGFKLIIIKEIFWKDLHIWVYILFCLYFVGSPCSGAMMTEQQLIYIEWSLKLLQLQQIKLDSETISTEVIVCDCKSKLWHLFRKIQNISKYKHFEFSARNLGRVSLPEFQLHWLFT